MSKKPIIPVSLYRLQLNPYFPFAKAKKFIPYYQSLGVEALYLSPIMKATPHSMHGYDICNPHMINDELGGEVEYRRFSKSLREAGLGQIHDIVANHMSATIFNPWWYSLLKEGPKSPYAHYFDVNFSPLNEKAKDKILLPILSASLEEELAQGKFSLVSRGDESLLLYGNHILPLNDKPLPREMKEIIAQQHYLLVHWREGPRYLNYRRFFDINELVVLRMQEDSLFSLYHKKFYELLSEENIRGFRIDHPDGFFAPKAYFHALQKEGKEPLYVIAEKILGEKEELPSNWELAGTVGYDFLNDLNGLFVQSEHEKEMTAIYHQFLGKSVEPRELLFECKRDFALRYMISEIRELVRKIPLKRSEDELTRALVTTLATFPVYRSYITLDDTYFRAEERNHFEKAISDALRHDPSLEASLLKEIFLPQDFALSKTFLLSFQQLSPTIMAKGFEDTFCYRYNRLMSLNEVGAPPFRFGLGVEEFHRRNQRRLEKWPGSLLATSTHDTKRSEDARMRLNQISEIPGRWKEHVFKWQEINSSHKKHAAIPDPNTEYLFYQNLLAIYPADEKINTYFVNRLKGYMGKAMREAKERTNWFDPEHNYEEKVFTFIEKVLDESNENFFESFLPFLQEISFYGKLSSLSALTLKIASPGVMETYQGCEIWDYSLVDPDNRRPVDFQHLSLLKNHPKQELIKRGLHLRRDFPDLFLYGSYLPLKIKGPKSRHFIAFARQTKQITLVALATRFLLQIKHEKDLNKQHRLEFDLTGFHNHITGEKGESLEEALKKNPFALLVKHHG